MSLQRPGLMDPGERKKAEAMLREDLRRDQITTIRLAVGCGVFLFFIYVMIYGVPG